MEFQAIFKGEIAEVIFHSQGHDSDKRGFHLWNIDDAVHLFHNSGEGNFVKNTAIRYTFNNPGLLVKAANLTTGFKHSFFHTGPLEAVSRFHMPYGIIPDDNLAGASVFQNTHNCSDQFGIRHLRSYAGRDRCGCIGLN